MRTAFAVAGLVMAAVSLLGVLGGILLVAVVAPHAGGRPEPRMPAPSPTAGPAPDLQLGQSIFRQHCARCHGIDAQGKIGPSLVDTRLSASDIQTVVWRGIPPLMPSFGNVLSPEEIRAVASYVEALDGTKAAAMQRPTAEAARCQRAGARQCRPWAMCR